MARRRKATLDEDEQGGDKASLLSELEIEIRVKQAQQAREEYERTWLAEEKAKYGLARQGRPLSRMLC